MIKAVVAGGTGYTAGELLRILINHPQIEIAAVLSSSTAGEEISSIHRDLLGDTDIKFVSDLSSAGGSEGAVKPDIIFLTLGHGLSRGYLDSLNISDSCKIIDLGNDFRLDSEYRGEEFVFGLCELNRDKIACARYIANPGCFATSILLPLVPLSLRGLLTDEIHIHAITGSTGAGKSLSETTHFSYRDSNISVYKPFTHQHLGEICKTLSSCAGKEIPQINFVPVRGDFTRGIFSSIYTKSTEGVSVDEVASILKSFYKNSLFVKISDKSVSLKEVVNTNKTLIHVEEHNGYWHFTSVIDNLLKGASGQAVQNMNIMFGLEEGMGLRLKGSNF